MELKEVIEIGETVLCDLCNDDYTDSNEVGGCIISSWAYCPKCTSKLDHDDLKRAVIAPAWVPFRILVLTARNGDNTIKIYVGEKGKAE